MFTHDASLPGLDDPDGGGVNASMGAFVFQAGYRRRPGVYGSYYSNTNTYAYANDRLPYYERCDYRGVLNITGSVLNVSALSRAALDASHNWDDDCQPFFTRACLPNHYAMVQYSPYSGLTYLLQCTPCPPHSISEGGFATQCACVRDYATTAALWGRVKVSAANPKPT